MSCACLSVRPLPPSLPPSLETSLGRQAAALEELVRAHYEPFVRCADGIHWLKEMLVAEALVGRAGGREGGGEGGGEGRKLQGFVELVARTKEGAAALFDPLLMRMEEGRR